ncbi:HAMP domain-containing histidine kinase [Myxococcota bacterium]|nr:HAMP domain-containing histidine kinase [Myxococcota bacterium]
MSALRRGHTLVGQLTRAAVGILTLALAVAGLATGALLHWRAVEAQDLALLAAAHAWRASLADPADSPWRAEHSVAPFHLSLLTMTEAGLPEPSIEGEDEDPRWRTRDGRRVLLLPVEIERGAEPLDLHAVIVAEGPAVDLADSVGAFAAAYGLVAGLVVLGGGLLMSSTLRRATAPLERARAEVGRVVGAGQGARVAEAGPTEVAALLVDVNALLDRLDRAFASQARFTAEAAHELRTPVTILRGELDLALRHAATGLDRATLQSLSEEVDRLAAVVEGLMTLARVDAGHAEQGRQAVALVDLVAEAVRHEGAAIAAGGGRLEVVPAPALDTRVTVSASLLGIALVNLLRNARVHAPGGMVRLSAERVGPTVLLHVDDDGPGVPADERERIFDRLQRGARARASTPGLGLGLPLAREVARRHGGDCTVADSPLGGARFTLRLPA